MTTRTPPRTPPNPDSTGDEIADVTDELVESGAEADRAARLGLLQESTGRFAPPPPRRPPARESKPPKVAPSFAPPPPRGPGRPALDRAVVELPPRPGPSLAHGHPPPPPRRPLPVSAASRGSGTPSPEGLAPPPPRRPAASPPTHGLPPPPPQRPPKRPLPPPSGLPAGPAETHAGRDQPSSTVPPPPASRRSPSSRSPENPDPLSASPPSPRIAVVSSVGQATSSDASPHPSGDTASDVFSLLVSPLLDELCTISQSNELVLHAAVDHESMDVHITENGREVEAARGRFHTSNEQGRPVIRFAQDVDPSNLLCVSYFRGKR